MFLGGEEEEKLSVKVGNLIQSSELCNIISSLHLTGIQIPVPQSTKAAVNKQHLIFMEDVWDIYMGSAP